MTVLDGIGLALLAVAGYMVAVALGCAIAGVGVLLISRGLAKRGR